MLTTANETVPALPVTPAQRRAYHDHGFLVVRGVFSAGEVARAVAEAERLVRRTDLIDQRNLRCRWQLHCDQGECLFETFDPVIDIAPVCARLAHHPRLLSILGELYGEPARLFKDKLIFKPPGARGYDLHQDYIAWPDFPRSFVTAAVAIDPCGLDNGCTVAYPGYHRGGCLSPEDGDYHPLPPETVDESTAVPLELEPGDVAIFGCFTPHRSAPNSSRRWRRLLYLSYNAASDGGDRREQHYRQFLAWLRKKYAEYGKTNVYFA
jgi:ectoine hydroxylase-related dioxygenase (phytanoyl-CoA dioxygenase family)